MMKKKKPNSPKKLLVHRVNPWKNKDLFLTKIPVLMSAGPLKKQTKI